MRYQKKYLIKKIIALILIVLIIFCGFVYFLRYLHYQPVKKFIGIIPVRFKNTLPTPNPITDVTINNVSVSDQTLSFDPGETIIIQGKTTPDTRIILTITQQLSTIKDIVSDRDGTWYYMFEDGEITYGSYTIYAQIQNSDQTWSPQYKLTKLIVGIAETEKPLRPIFNLFIFGSLAILIIMTWGLWSRRISENLWLRLNKYYII